MPLERQLFFLALRFLTRLNVPGGLSDSDDLAVRSTKYHPLVGALVGGIGVVGLVLAQLALDPGAALIVAVIAMLLVTGGFHEIGLAHAADVIGGSQSRAEALSMLDDKWLGGYGGLALIMVIALKLSLLAAMPLAVACMALILSNAMGRMATVHVVSTTYIAKDIGMRARVPGVTNDGYWFAFATIMGGLIAAALIFGPVFSICAFLGAVVLAQMFRILIIRKLGGYTGPCLGGVEQMGEVGTLLGIAIWL